MNHAPLHLEIPLSKSKMLLLLFAALLFVILGIWFLTDPGRFASNGYRHRPVELIIAVGGAAILFFGTCTVFIFKKLFDTEPGMVINETGFIDNSSAVKTGLVLWEDINDIGVMKISRQKLISIYLKNPKEYIDRQPSKWKRKLMAINQRSYGTPIHITSNSLKISFNELEAMLRNNLASSKLRDNRE